MMALKGFSQSEPFHISLCQTYIECRISTHHLTFICRFLLTVLKKCQIQKTRKTKVPFSLLQILKYFYCTFAMCFLLTVRWYMIWLLVLVYLGSGNMCSKENKIVSITGKHSSYGTLQISVLEAIFKILCTQPLSSI